MKKISACLIFYLLVCFPLTCQEKISPEILAVTVKTIDTNLLIPDIFYRIRNNKDYILFFNARKILLKTGDQIKDFCDIFPYTFEPDDCFTEVYLDDEYLIISVYNYPEKQKKSDSSAPLGAFKEGPKDKGMIFLNLKDTKPRLIESLPVANYREYAEKDVEFDKTNKDEFQKHLGTIKTMVPSFYSIVRAGDTFFLCGIGNVTALSTKPEFTLSYLDLDYDYTFTRYALLKDGNDLWYVSNEGGMSGACIINLNIKNLAERIIDTYPDCYIYPDSIVIFNEKIFFSSRAGLQEINKEGQVLHQYVIDDRLDYHLLYRLRLYKGALFAISRKGIVKFQPENNTAVLYKFNGFDIIYDFLITDEITFIATEKGVLTAPPLP